VHLFNFILELVGLSDVALEISHSLEVSFRLDSVLGNSLVFIDFLLFVVCDQLEVSFMSVIIQISHLLRLVQVHLKLVAFLLLLAVFCLQLPHLRLQHVLDLLGVLVLLFRFEHFLLRVGLIVLLNLVQLFGLISDRLNLRVVDQLLSNNLQLFLAKLLGLQLKLSAHLSVLYFEQLDVLVRGFFVVE